MIRHHPPEDRLAAYAAGTAGEAEALLLAAHLVLCPLCRRQVGHYEAVGGLMLEQLPGEALGEGSLERTLAAVDRPAPEPPPPPPAPPAPPGLLPLPRPVCSLVGQDMARIAWRWAGPGVRYCRLPLASGRAWLLRVAPGRAMPRHGHAGSEMVLVLRGGYRDGAEAYVRGDVHAAGPETRHRPVADPGEDCLCLAVIEGRLRLSNPLGSIVASFLGF